MMCKNSLYAIIIVGASVNIVGDNILSSRVRATNCYRSEAVILIDKKVVTAIIN